MKIKREFSTETYTEVCDNVCCPGFDVRYEVTGHDKDGTEWLCEQGEWVKRLVEVRIDKWTTLNMCVACEDATEAYEPYEPWLDCIHRED